MRRSKHLNAGAAGAGGCRRVNARRVAIAGLIVLTLLQAGFGTQVRGHVDAALDSGVARDAALATVGRLDYLHRDLAFVVLIGATVLTLWLLSRRSPLHSLVFRRPCAGDRADRARRGDGVCFAVTGRAGRASNHRQPVIGRGNGVVALEPEAERMRIRVPTCGGRLAIAGRDWSRVRTSSNRRRPPANQSAHDAHGAPLQPPARRGRRCSAISARITAPSRPRTPTRRSFSMKG